jgi:hypothetical protein
VAEERDEEGDDGIKEEERFQGGIANRITSSNCMTAKPVGQWNQLNSAIPG